MGLVTWLRRRRLPARLRPALAGDERVLAWAPVAPGVDPVPAEGVLVATDLGLWLPGAAGRTGWHEIHKAAWSGQVLTLTMAVAAPGGTDRYAVLADAAPVEVRLADPDRLPAQVRQRVSRSVAYTSLHELAAGGAVRVVARRVRGVDGLRWTVRYEGGADGTDPAVAAATADLVERAAASLATPL